jgi:hypothetical protein
MERPAPCFEQPLKKRFKDDSSDGPLGNAFAALAAIFQNREADLAWPERSKGTWVPAFEEAASFDSRAPPARSALRATSLRSCPKRLQAFTVFLASSVSKSSVFPKP